MCVMLLLLKSTKRFPEAEVWHLDNHQNPLSRPGGDARTPDMADSEMSWQMLRGEIKIKFPPPHKNKRGNKDEAITGGMQGERDWLIYLFSISNRRVAPGSRTAHDPAGWGRHHEDRGWLEETEHAGPLSGTVLIAHFKKNRKRKKEDCSWQIIVCLNSSTFCFAETE